MLRQTLLVFIMVTFTAVVRVSAQNSANPPDFSAPTSIARDSVGNLYIASAKGNVVYKLDTRGELAIIAGNGSAGFSGDGGFATRASLNFPGDLAVDSLGNLYIADTFNNRIRRVDASTGIITTVAGNGTAGFSGDGGPAVSASLNAPGVWPRIVLAGISSLPTQIISECEK